MKRSRQGRPFNLRDRGRRLAIKGYNDRPKPCLWRGCKGMVQPTSNTDMGQCDKCGRRFHWAALG